MTGGPGLRGKPVPAWLAEPRHEDLPLHSVYQPAELNETGSDRGIIDLAQIPGQQLVGHTKPRSHDMELPAHPFANPGRGGGLVEADVFAAARIGDQARLELLDTVAITINHRGGNALLGLIGAEHDAHHAGLGLLANELSLRPIIKIA